MLFKNEINYITESNFIKNGIIMSAFSDYNYCSDNGFAVGESSLGDNMGKSEQLKSELIDEGFSVTEIYYYINNELKIDYAIFSMNEGKDFIGHFINKAKKYIQDNILYLPKESLFGWNDRGEYPLLFSFDPCAERTKVKTVVYQSLKYKIFNLPELEKLILFKNTYHKITKRDKKIKVKIMKINILGIGKLIKNNNINFNKNSISVTKNMIF